LGATGRRRTCRRLLADGSPGYRAGRTGSRSAAQASVDYWHRRVADTFGRTDSEHAERYIEYGLRRRTNRAMLADWQEQAAAALSRLGLAVPA